MYESKNFTINGKFYDVQQILSKLRFFSKIKKNEKLHLENKALIEDTWYNSILRTLFMQKGRNDALNFIKEICNESLETIEVFLSSEDSFHREIADMIVLTLTEAQIGILNYVETYKKDRLFVSDVESFLDILKARISNLQKTRVDVL